MNYVIITLLLVSVAFFIWAAQRQTYGKKALNVIVCFLVLLIGYHVFADEQKPPSTDSGDNDKTSQEKKK